MQPGQFKKYFSGVAISLVILHLLFPKLGIDFVTISLVLIAVLPWILPILKSIELPGGFKIELKDTKAATDKVVTTGVLTLSGTVRAKSSASGNLTVEGKEVDPISTLRQIADADSSLAFVGFRIEVEKRLRLLAEQHGLRVEREPLYRILRELQARQLVPNQVASGLADLIALGNRAAHGSEVEPEAVNWLLDVGPSILAILDELLRPRSAKAGANQQMHTDR